MNWSCAQKYLFYWVVAYSSSPSVNSLRFFHWLLFRAWICSQSLFTPNSPLSVCIPPAEHRALLKPFDTCWTAALDGMRYTTMLLRKLISFASLALLFFTLRASSSLLCLCVYSIMNGCLFASRTHALPPPNHARHVQHMKISYVCDTDAIPVSCFCLIENFFGDSA